MKKFVICLMAFALVAGVYSVSFGRTVNEEIQALRNYISVLDTRIAKAHKAKQNSQENRLFAIKQATQARLDAFYAPKAVAPALAPTAEIIRVYASPEVSKSGRGFAFYANGGLDAGLSGFAINLEYDLSGKPAEGVKIRTGANYIAGNNPTGGDLVKAISAKLGAVYYITPFMPRLGIPLTWYIGGAYLKPVRVYGDRTGTYGLEAYLGSNYNVPEMGIFNFEVGYGALKYATGYPALKGIDLKIGYGIVF